MAKSLRAASNVAEPRAEFSALLRRIHPKHSPAYSKNLRLWMMNHGRAGDNIFQAVAGSKLAQLYGVDAFFIGQHYDGYEGDNDFSGVQLMQVLCMGSSANRACFPGGSQMLTEVSDFWNRYERVGRCAIDPNHQIMFVEFEKRFHHVDGQRTCRWCSQVVPHSP